MDKVRSLRELFASASDTSGPAGASPGPADPHLMLDAAGHGALPTELVTEAIINYADAAPLEVAQHLAPFVMAHSAVPGAAELAHWAGDDDGPDAAQGWALLSSAPQPTDSEFEHSLAHHDPLPHDLLPHDVLHHDLDAGHQVADHGFELDHPLLGHSLPDHSLPDHSLPGHPLLGHDPQDLDFGHGRLTLPGEHTQALAHDLTIPHQPGLPESALPELGLHEAGLHEPVLHEPDDAWAQHDVDDPHHLSDQHHSDHHLSDQQHGTDPTALDDASAHEPPLDPGHGI